ncbi:HGR084Wp [Eremothecium sinecaudum]|uniref:HGR084Wp n=1 Tax=Eremothecium sinecaudum TaxID=45286 RepID=A0A109V0E1_9SACH|nr:HGR084Wp [Eremothecium sinecaudum]AMD22423.1 HGR084Wp [Eremothecium sinecaudum]
MRSTNLLLSTIVTTLAMFTYVVNASKVDLSRHLNSTAPLISTWSDPVNKSTVDSIKAIKGISIGGWLVTEPYITPSLYWSAKHSSYANSRTNVNIVDEYTLCKALGQEKARQLLTQHYNSWITRKDIQNIKKHGFNLVRIPIGYWAWKKPGSIDRYVNDMMYYDPYVGGIQLSYFNRALRWCRDAGLKVMIDLHGVPGSQNGFDNSGRRIFDGEGELGWLKEPGTRELTVEILKVIYEEYTTGEWKDLITGIEVVNEPMASRIGEDDIISFYEETIDDYTESDAATTLVLHDAFQPLGYWDEYRNDTKLPILIDHHHYEVFNYHQNANDQFSRLSDILEYGDDLAKEQASHPSIVGEWSGAITDCATWLNGIGIGSRYDGTYYDKLNRSSSENGALGTCQSYKSISEWDSEYKTRVRQFIEAQLVSYTNNSKGWIFWNWKTETAPEWDYLKLVESNLFPHPFDNLTYFYPNGSIKATNDSSLLSASGVDLEHRHANGAARLTGNPMLQHAFQYLSKLTPLLAAVALVAVVSFANF